jgi:hypothetical protein
METRENLEKRVAELEKTVAALTGGYPAIRGFRRRSSQLVAGIPLYDIAVGPDIAHGEWRGHARGVIAIGDFASGVIAIGGLSRGVIAVGGLALGLLSFGGLSVGVLAAAGGLALGGLALGGGAVGSVAVGGGAVGYYACGGGAAGVHTVSGFERDPEAVAFFREHGLGEACGANPRRR